MSICAETKGRFELDPESGEPNGNCVFARLIRAVYTRSSLASADAKDAPSTDAPYRAVYPDTGPNQAINKTQPDCLKLVAIIRKCKFKIAAITAANVINKDDRNAFNTPFTHAVIGDSERQYQEEIPPPISQMGGYGKGRLAKCWGDL